MKILNFIFIYLILFSSSFSQTGWYELKAITDKIQNQEKTGFDFFDENIGIILTKQNAYLTLDGGKNLQKLNYNLDTNKSEYNDVFILTPKTIFISTNEVYESLNKNCLLLFSEDSAKTFNVIQSLEYKLFRSVKFCNNILYSKLNGQLTYSKNLGLDWNIIDSNITVASYSCNENNLIYIEYIVGVGLGVYPKLYLHVLENNKEIKKYEAKDLINSDYVDAEFKSIIHLNGKNWITIVEDTLCKSSDNGFNFEKISKVDFNINFVFIKDSLFYSYKDKKNYIYKVNYFNEGIKCTLPNNIRRIEKIKVINENISYAKVVDSNNKDLILKTTDGGGVFTEVEEDIKEAQEIKISGSKNSSYSLELKYPPSQAKLELINILGVPIFSQSTISQLLNISLEPYPTGIYLLKYTDKYSTQVFKLLRE